MAKRSSILISGWRMLPHSYALVTQFQCLELLRRPELQLYFEDLPYYNPQWQPVRGVFPATDEQAILPIPTMPAGMTPDAELRIVYPYDLIRPPRGRRTCTFGTAEYRVVPPQDIADRTPLAQAHLLHDRGIVILTRSSPRGLSTSADQGPSTGWCRAASRRTASPATRPRGHRRSSVSNAGIERGAHPRGRAFHMETRRRQAAGSAAATVRGPITSAPIRQAYAAPIGLNRPSSGWQ